MAAKYCFNKLCFSSQLSTEIAAAGITTAIDHIDVHSGNTEIFFVSDLSLKDQINLNRVVADHGSPSMTAKTSPFAAKVLPNGKRIFTRIHGISGAVQNSPDTIDFTVPYTSCKITGIEITNGKIGDTANFKVVDTAQGSYSGVPNYVLNQFGFDVNISEKEYKYKSDYDADLYGGMKLRIEYDPVDEILPRTIYINFILHEIKD